MHITFYKHVSKIINENKIQKNYLSNEPLLKLLDAFFVEKTRFFSDFFSNSKFGTRVYKGKIEPGNESIPLYTFLRIFLRKINILKKTKLGPIEFNAVDDKNIKEMLLNLTNIL